MIPFLPRRRPSSVVATDRLVVPVVLLNNAELKDFVTEQLSQQATWGIEDIDRLHEEIAIRFGYIPIDRTQSSLNVRTAGLVAVERYREYCTKHGRALIIGYCSANNCTLLIDVDTRSPFGRFSSAEKAAIDMATRQSQKWFGQIMNPGDMRRYRTLPWYAHEMAVRIFAALKRPAE